MNGRIANWVVATLAATAAVAATVCVSATPAAAADAGYCAQYARLAVHEAQVLSTMPCFRGFDGRWHLNYDQHFGWCITTSREAAAAQRDYRRMRLYQCGYRG